MEYCHHVSAGALNYYYIIIIENLSLFNIFSIDLNFDALIIGLC